jgi:hypothetical protein
MAEPTSGDWQPSSRSEATTGQTTKGGCAMNEEVICHRNCPELGRLREGFYTLRCECGRTIRACFVCVNAGRITGCECGGTRMIVSYDYDDLQQPKNMEN